MPVPRPPRRGASPARRFREIFRTIKTRYDQSHSRDPDLFCKQGFYGGCPVLKLQKAAWTNDDMRKVPNQTGIFFSIWITKAGARKNRAEYNLHALQLRLLDGYMLTGNDFCDQFRKRFKRVRRGWPNVGTDSGCLTLMEGWFEIDEKTFARDALALMDRFHEVSPIIDDLLKQRKKPVRRA